MIKKVTLLICLLGIYTISIAQTMNESQGTGALDNITSGDYNVAFGDSTLTKLSSGSYNTALGYRAGYNITTGSEGVYIGHEAGFTDDNAQDNTMIGFRAGYFNTATDNTFMGNDAGFYNTTGNDNTFIGEKAGMRVTDGDDNTYIGHKAGPSSYSSGVTSSTTSNPSTGSDNTAVGSSAGYNITTGYRNTFIGNDAGWDNKDGYRNTAVGDSAGTDIGSGYYNTMIGQGAGAATEHADFNTFIGTRAGWDNNRNNNTSNANRNTYVGVMTGSSNRMGEDNVGMGSFASFGSSGGGTSPLTDPRVGSRTDTSRATFIGADADAGNHDVTMLGYSTRVDGQYGIAIGNEADLGNATGGIGMGYQAILDANGDYSVGIGYQVNISDNDAVGIGRSVDVDKAESVSIGANSIVQNDGAIVIGYGANSMDLKDDPDGFGLPDATNTIAIGYNAASSGFYSVAIGSNASAATDNAMVLGGATNPLSVGIGTDAPNAYASLTLDDTNKGLLVNRLTTVQKTSLQGNLTATDYGMVVYDTDLKGLYVWDGTQWLSALSDNLGDHLATTTLDMGANIVDNATYLNIDNTEGYGIRFWNGNNNYKISMGNSSEYQYGAVTDYSIKNGMNSTAGRGWTWGVTGQTPIASIDNTGKMQIANTMTIGAYTLPNTDGTSTQVLSTDGSGAVTWVDATVNTDAQDLSLSSNILSLTNDGTTVDLSGYLDNTDAQDLSLSGTILSLTNDGTTVDLSVLQDGIGTDSQDLSLSGNTLSLTNDGTSVDLSSFANTDSQELSLSTNTLSISGGTNTVDLSAYVNTDAQNLTSATLTGTTVEIAIDNGTSVSVDLAPLLADLENRVTLLEACDCNVLPVDEYTPGRMSPVLQQNIPNPFNGTSTMGYFIPQSISKADIVFSNNVGQIVNTINITNKGEGEISINSSNYASGMYYYTLYLDGKKIDTKKMIVN